MIGRLPTISLAALLLIAAGYSSAQEFEAVSIKPDTSGSNGTDSNSDAGRITATASLRSFILMAYGLKDYQVEGPAWLDSARFNITGKFPEGIPKEGPEWNTAFETMMQKMLAERFGLTVHLTKKPFPVYGLRVGKRGIRFKEVPDTGGNSSNSKGGHYSGHCVTMEKFATFVSRLTDLPTINETRLKGCYDLTLNWVPDSKYGAVQTEGQPGPTLRDALEDQLGLKLENRKAAFDVLIVDHAERNPTEN